MEVLVFILQRFYWGLGAGCFMNFFFIGNYYILTNKVIFPEDLQFFNDIKNISSEISIFIFIVATLIIGMIIEGIDEIGCQSFQEKRGSMYKKKHNSEEKDIYKKLSFYGRLFFFIFRETTTIEACTKIEREEKDKERKNPIYNFMRAQENKGNATTAMQTWAKIVSKEEKSNRVYVFRDLSFMFQLMRSASLIISIISFLLFLCLLVYYILNRFDCSLLFYLALALSSITYICAMTPILFPFNDNKLIYKIIRNIIAFLSFIIFIIIIISVDRMRFLLWWYILSFFISMLFFILATHISVYFGKRYVRDVGTSYNSLCLKKQ